MNTLLRKIAKAYALGVYDSYQLFRTRFLQQRFQARNYTHALQQQAHTTWDVLCFTQPHVQHLAEALNQNPLMHVRTIMHVAQPASCIEKADAIINGKIPLFNQTVMLAPLAWHTDVLCMTSDNMFDPHQWYATVTIKPGTTACLEKDIRVVWELSRATFLHPVVGAYQRTQQELYAHWVINTMLDWIAHNPYLLGANWVCPMEVALRALNWIIALEGLGYHCIAQEAWQRIVCSLYDHMQYLEHHWEWYDGRTSNHYAANLVGYLALCYFFQLLPATAYKRQWCIAELRKELGKQFFPDGTSYEGSTAYHRLMTELVLYAYAFMCDMHEPLASVDTHRLYGMLALVRDCTINTHDFITIGDDDTSRVVTGWSPAIQEAAYTLIKKEALPAESVRQYPYFGLSVLKKDHWHVTVRHQRYRAQQPSGHFHNDMASITVAYQGIPLIIDPGSYVYSASAYWRNAFRSIKAHSTMTVNEQEPISFDEHLFSLSLPVQESITPEMMKINEPRIVTSHALYYGVRLYRSIELLDNQLSITDWAEPTAAFELSADTYVTWRFVVAPSITVVSKTPTSIHLFHEGQPFMAMHACDVINIVAGWATQSYTVKSPTRVLVIKQPLQFKARYQFIFNSALYIVMICYFSI